MPSKGNKAQITIFILIVMVLVIISGVTFYLISSVKKQEVVSATQTVLSTSTLNVKKFVQECVKLSVDKGIDEFGSVDQNLAFLLQEELKSEIPSCTDDFKYFEDQGMVILAGDIDPSVSVGDKVITTRVEYPLTIKIGDQETKISSFIYEVDRKLMEEYTQSVQIDEYGRLKKPLDFTVGRLHVFVPAGIMIIQDGRAINGITVRQVSSDDNPGVNVGVLDDEALFEFLPEDVTYEGSCLGGCLTLEYELETDELDLAPNLRFASRDSDMHYWEFTDTELVDGNLVAQFSGHSFKAVLRNCVAEDGKFTKFKIDPVYMQPLIFLDENDEEINCAEVDWDEDPVTGELYHELRKNEFPALQEEPLGRPNILSEGEELSLDLFNRGLGRYGYPSIEAAGGTGYMSFEIGDGSCVAAENAFAMLFTRCDDVCTVKLYHDGLLDEQLDSYTYINPDDPGGIPIGRTFDVSRGRTGFEVKVSNAVIGCSSAGFEIVVDGLADLTVTRTNEFNTIYDEPTCPYSCEFQEDCTRKGGIQRDSFSCPSYYFSDRYSSPAVCCDISDTGVNQDTIEFIELSNSVLEESKEDFEFKGFFAFFDYLNLLSLGGQGMAYR